MGEIQVITGPMFAGKTTELLRRLERYKMAGKSITVFRPDVGPTVHSLAIASTRQKINFKVEVISARYCLINHPAKTDVVAFDEAQFFDDIIVPNVQGLRDQGKIILISGLDMDYLHRPFGSMGNLMATADRVDKLTAVCSCGNEARYTQRMDNDSLVYKTKQAYTEGTYAPICQECYNELITQKMAANR